MLYNSHDEFIGKSLALYGEWSEPECFLFEQIVKAGDTVVEAGANIGSHTVMLSKATGENGRVLAFEPQRYAYQLLCANLALNECLNVHAFQKAVGAHSGEIGFPVLNPRERNNFGALSIYTSGYDTESTPIISLDSLELTRLDFLKADVEGFEVNVIDGARILIENCRPIVHLEYVNHYTGDNANILFDWFAPLDYRMWFFITPLFNSENFRGNRENAFPGIWSFDMVCIPRERGELRGLTEANGTNSGYCDNPNAWRDVRYVAHT